jgi:hypothetical protein
MRFFQLTLILIALSVIAPAKEKALTPPSYQQAIKCIPEVKSESLAKDFNLTALKAEIDHAFPSFNMQLLSRDIFLSTKTKEKRVLHLKPIEGKTLSFEMSLEAIDEKGVHSNLPLIKPRGVQSDINQQIGDAEIDADEKTYDDTKLNNSKLSFKTNKNEVVELVFRAENARQKLYCYLKEQVGPICTCK